jgi:hypothetical protein
MSHEYLLVFTIDFNSFSQLPDLRDFVTSGIQNIGAFDASNLVQTASQAKTSAVIKKIFYYGNIFVCIADLVTPLAENPNHDPTIMDQNTARIKPLVDSIFPQETNRFFVWCAIPWHQMKDEASTGLLTNVLGQSGGIGTGRNPS